MVPPLLLSDSSRLLAKEQGKHTEKLPVRACPALTLRLSFGWEQTRSLPFIGFMLTHEYGIVKYHFSKFIVKRSSISKRLTNQFCQSGKQ